MVKPAASKTLGRINFKLPPELHLKLLQMSDSGQIKDVSTFIRSAIDEKLEAGKADPLAARISDTVRDLNRDGKAWLLQCAQVAAGNDKFKE